MNYRVQEFTSDQQPSDEMLRDAYTLFQQNIPSFDKKSRLDNEHTLQSRMDPVAYRKILKDTSVLFALNTQEKIVGLLEWDSRDRADVFLAMMTWIMVANTERGNGVASVLHQHFESACVPSVIQQTRKPVYQALGVHLQNPAKEIYRKWGYVKGPIQYNDGRRLFMVKQASTGTDV